MLRTRAAADLDCPEHRLTLEKRRRDVWSAEGCGRSGDYRLTGRRPDRTWVREFGYVEPTRSPRTKPATTSLPPAMPVVFARKSEAQGVVLTATLQPRAAETIVIQLQGAPEQDADVAMFVFNRPRTQGPLDTCELRLVADGEAVPMPPDGKHEVAGHAARMIVKVPVAALGEAARAKRLIGQVCNTRFEFTPHNLATIENFVVRMREELALRPAKPRDDAGIDAP